MVQITKNGFKLLDEADFYLKPGITDDFDHEFQIMDQLFAEHVGLA